MFLANVFFANDDKLPLLIQNYTHTQTSSIDVIEQFHLCLNTNIHCKYYQHPIVFNDNHTYHQK